MTPLKVACIGEAMVELSLDSEHPDTAGVGFAGDTLNTAIYLKRTAPELDVSYVTRLGKDAFSNKMLEFIQAENISTEAITFSEKRTLGLYTITTDDKGERTFAYWRDTSAAREMFQTPNGISFDILETFDVLYFSAITLAILPSEVRAALLTWLPIFQKSTGGRVIFDSNHRPLLWPDAETCQTTTADFWKITDIALPSIDDELAVFGTSTETELLARFAEYGVTQGALKRGEQGPTSLGDPVQASYTAADKVIDTTAAGDSFNGGYLGAFLTGADQATALRAGHDLAAKVVGVKGAIIPR